MSVLKEAVTVLRREGVEGQPQGGMQIVEGASRRLAQVSFEFGERQFNGIEIGAVRRQVADANAPRREQLEDVLDFVGGEVVENDRVTRAQLRTEPLRKLDCEDIGLDGAFDPKGSGHTVMA